MKVRRIQSNSLPFSLCSPRTCSRLIHPLKVVGNTFWRTRQCLTFAWPLHKQNAPRSYQLEGSLSCHLWSLDTIGGHPFLYSPFRSTVDKPNCKLCLLLFGHLVPSLCPLPLQLYMLQTKRQSRFIRQLSKLI